MWENQETFKRWAGRKDKNKLWTSAKSWFENLRRAPKASKRAAIKHIQRACSSWVLHEENWFSFDFFLCQINLLSFHLSVRVEQLEQRHDQLLHADVSVPVLLHVVAHGLPLRLRQQVACLLLQHGPRLVHQAGKCHLRAGHAFIKSRLLSGGMEEKRTRWRGRFESFSSFECYLLSFYNNWFYIWFLG